MFRRTVFTGLVAVGLTSCMYHLDSAVPDEFAHYNPALLGTWVNEDSSQAVITSDDSLYRVEYRQQGEPSTVFHGRVGRIGGRDVLEIWPSFGATDETWPVARFLLVIDVRADEITTWSLQPDSVLAASKRDGTDFPYLERADDVVLTAPTSTLVRAFAEYVRRPGYLEDEEIWRRTKMP